MSLEAMSSGKNRVYALINSRRQLQSIVFYDKSGTKKRQIDLTHDHGKGILHAHMQDISQSKRSRLKRDRHHRQRRACFKHVTEGLLLLVRFYAQQKFSSKSSVH